MIETDRIREIAKILLEKTRVDQVNWIDMGKGNSATGLYVETLGVIFPKSKFLLKKGQPRTEPDFYVAIIETEQGVDAGRLMAAEPTDNPESNDDPNWSLLCNLWVEAKRYLTGWDKALSDIEANIHSEGVIGLPSNQK